MAVVGILIVNYFAEIVCPVMVTIQCHMCTVIKQLTFAVIPLNTIYLSNLDYVHKKNDVHLYTYIISVRILVYVNGAIASTETTYEVLYIIWNTKYLN